jgi:hypothetical protein
MQIPKQKTQVAASPFSADHREIDQFVKEEFNRKINKPNRLNESAGAVTAHGYAYNQQDQRVAWTKEFASEAAAKEWARRRNATVLSIVPKTVNENNPAADWPDFGTAKTYESRLKEAKQRLGEAWSQKYKSSINCSHPKGFSQKAHCAGKKKHNESVEMEMVCESCGMCETHGNINEIKKGQKDSNGYTKCWPGKHAEGTKKGRNGGQVRNCVPNESVAEGAFDIFKKLPPSGSTVKIAGRPVEISYGSHGGEDNSHVNFSWNDTNGKEHYGEARVETITNLRALAKRIKSEMDWVEQQNAKQGVAENWGEPLTGWHVVYARTGNKVSGTPDFDSRDSAQKYLMTKMSANHHNFRVAHADQLGTSAPTPLGGYLESKGMAEGKWNYPPEYTKKANADDEAELGVSLINKDARKAWRKKQKAKAHKDLMTGKKKEPGVAEAAKWRTHPDAHDHDTDGSPMPKGGIKSDPLATRQGVSRTQSEKDPKSLAGKFGDKYAKKHGVPTKQLMKNIPLDDIDEQGVAEGERNEMDTPAVQAALKNMSDRHKNEKWSKEQLAALGKRLAAQDQKPVKEGDVVLLEWTKGAIVKIADAERVIVDEEFIVAVFE